MRLAIIILVACFIAVVVGLVATYSPSSRRDRASAIADAIAQENAAAASGPGTPASSATAPSAGTRAGEPGASATSGSADAASMLKEEHSREAATQFDRALLFLAPAAPAPLIEDPVATAAAVEAIPQSTEVATLPAEARNWRGVVLVPKNMVLATAHTAAVRIARIEAHPLDDGNVRIWARIQNPSISPIKIGTTCTFRYAGQVAGVSRGFLEVEIPPGGYYDADYLSPQSGVETYTILVRSF